MKQGRSLTELAQELERQVKSKKDFKAPTSLLEAEVAQKDFGQELSLKINGHGSFKPTKLAHDQIGSYTGIPSKYYDRMLADSPELLATNINHWFHRNSETRLVRTLDGSARAFLSNRYRTIDNYDVAMAALPILTEDKQHLEIASSEVTDNRLYIKATTARLQYEVKKGDVVQAGIVISNSEVGLGAVRVEPMLYRLICLNGAIIADGAMRKFHIGRHSEELETAYQVFTDETRKQDDRAFMMKLQDVVRSAFDELNFEKLKGMTIDAATRRISAPQHAVETVVEQYHLPESYADGLLARLIESSDLTQWGLANAVTNLANDRDSYDHATELERIGGELITLEPKQWAQYASAA